MSLHRRLAALEKKRRVANAEDNRILGILNYCDSQGFPKWDGVHRPGVQVIGVIGGTRIPAEDWESHCRDQQRRLLAQCEAFAEQLNEGSANENFHKPEPSGELPPLPPGKKRPQYILIKDANGVEWQQDRLTGEKWRT
ncbi:hypothetical protein [Pseudogemmobacter sonorensis]|uniref:hypothetical protein n=1 Tax=Pseudogemmobacter sonorensis TaxID=2989681 RepID=UPI0036A35717